MPPVDPFQGYPDQVMAQGRRLLAVVPDDNNDLPFIPKALLVGTGAGDICFDPVDKVAGDPTGIVVPVSAGDIFDAVRVRRVRATGTTATPIYMVL